MSNQARRTSRDRYINLLTDFGFKRLFGTELTKALLIDFLNVVLPKQHQVKDITYRNSENVGNTPIDRKAIFDIYCESETGEKFIVEIQKAKQNYFKDRSVYYSTFPIQEQAEKGDWDYQLSSVYTVGVLDFVFDDHKDDETILHTVELKDQNCEVFYDKLKFIYLELPKFKKTVDQLDNHFEKWLFLLKHLSELSDRPQPLQEGVFNQLFEVAEIANFSPEEQESYETSLKYYRDIKNVVDTSRQEGIEEGIVKGIEQGIAQERAVNLEQQRSLALYQLSKRLGLLSDEDQADINRLGLEPLVELGRIFLDFDEIEDLRDWLKRQ